MSSESRARKLKRTRYQKAGVPEYWIVDPFEHKVEQLVLGDSDYVMLSVTDVLPLTILEGISVPLGEVWQEQHENESAKQTTSLQRRSCVRPE